MCVLCLLDSAPSGESLEPMQFAALGWTQAKELDSWVPTSKTGGHQDRPQVLPALPCIPALPMALPLGASPTTLGRVT